MCCMECYDLQVESEFDFVVQVQGCVEFGDEIEFEEFDFDVVLFFELFFEIELLIVEQIELQLLMKFFCFDDCKGLCVECGNDFNWEFCVCMIVVDVRFVGLVVFKQCFEEKD